MKILIVSWSILPGKGGSSIIIENLAQHFQRDELVVLGAKKLFQNTTMQRPASAPAFHYFLSELHVFGRGMRFFNWFRQWRFAGLVKKIKSMITKENIDYVIGVYPNEYYCLAACRAAAQLQIPFSAYFHNTFTENVAITDKRAAAIQKGIFDQSEYIFVMSEGMQRFYEQKYPGYRFRPLVHTFDAYPEATILSGTPGAQKEAYKLVAIGNFNESNMDATIRFAKAIRNNPKYSLSLYTHVPKVLLRQRGLDTDGIIYKGYVKPEEVHQILQDYDIAVLTHGFTGGYGAVEYQTIFPTRTIPLLLSGKPIIAHSPAGSFLNHFIQKNKCALLVDQADEDAILQALTQLCGDATLQRELVDNSMRTAKQFYGPEVVAAWVAGLRKYGLAETQHTEHKRNAH